jgi:hypothetical protein
MWLMPLGYLTMSLGFCMVWAAGFAASGHGVKCGAIYGLFMSVFGLGGVLLGMVFNPTPMEFALPWVGGSLVAGLFGGMLVALVYKPKGGDGGGVNA